MQQELIEMLEEIIPYVGVWNKEDQAVLDKAEALVEKAKNNNAPATDAGVVEYKPVGYLRSHEFDGHDWEPVDDEWPLGELLYAARAKGVA
jgi:hypothetical protein